jgi:hypothetical protein
VTIFTNIVRSTVIVTIITINISTTSINIPLETSHHVHVPIFPHSSRRNARRAERNGGGGLCQTVFISILFPSELYISPSLLFPLLFVFGPFANHL